MHSMPPAMTISAAPVWIFWLAVITGLHPGTADSVHGEGRGVLGNIPMQSCLRGWILPFPGLEHISHDHQVHFILPNLGPRATLP